jgi:hypothetical protein
MDSFRNGNGEVHSELFTPNFPVIQPEIETSPPFSAWFHSSSKQTIPTPFKL